MNLYDVITKLAGDPQFPDDTQNVSERTTDPRSQTQIIKNAPMGTPREGGQFVSPNITGDYGTRYMSEEASSMNTPVMPQPNSDYLEPEVMGTIKNAGYEATLEFLGVKLATATSPAAIPQAPQPTTPMSTPPAPPVTTLTPTQVQQQPPQTPAVQNTPAAQAWQNFR